MVYKWTMSMFASVDANDVGKEIERIEKENGEVTNKAVVDAARSKENVMHSLFEWDDAVAGEKYRLTQAASMIRALVVVPENKGEYDKRAFVNIVENAENPKNIGRYINYDTAMSDEDMRKIVLKNALHELIVFKGKYKALKELAKVYEAIDEVQMKLDLTNEGVA